MYLLNNPRLWLAALWLSLVSSGYGQAPVLSNGTTFQVTVTEGRSSSINAATSLKSGQWQVFGANGSWSNLSDDATYQGTATSVLEVVGVTAGMDGLFFRFTTSAGGNSASAPIRLTVSAPVLPSPDGLCFDQNVGQYHMPGLYVSDSANHTIRYLPAGDTMALLGWGNLTDTSSHPLVCPVSTVAGKSGQAGAMDGPAAAALFNQPGGLALTGAGTTQTLMVADTANGSIRRIALGDGKVTTLAGSGSLRGNQDGTGAAASFSSPSGMARGPGDVCYVADTTNHTIRKVTADGVVTTLAGSPGNAGTADGTGAAARFNSPTGIAVDAGGVVYVADTGNNSIRRITAEGVVTTLAGVPGVAGTQDGVGTQATFNGPTGLALGGVLYVADTGNSTIRSVSVTTGVVKTYAGLPGVAGLSDGYLGVANSETSPLGAMFDHPRALAYASDTGMLIVADTGNAAIRIISTYDGIATVPLAEGPAYVFTPAPASTPPASVTPAPPITPSTPAAPAAADVSGGGGAPSEWFLAALAVMGALRGSLRRRSNAATQEAPL